MAGFTTLAPDFLIRGEIWSQNLKEQFEDTLQAVKYVDWMDAFPDGDQFTIPSVGQAEVQNYVEDSAVQYRAMDTGEFIFTITEYLQSGHYMTVKMQQDSMYAAKVMAGFVPKQHQAIMERVERDVLNLAMSQTLSAPNAINGADHRWVGSGTNETIALRDFAKARFSLQKANVPMRNLVAIVDPSVGYALDVSTNLVNISNPNPLWADIIEKGFVTGMHFIKNVYGFDVYVSNFLADANETITETGGSARTTAAGKANVFFANLGGDWLPFKGAWRQQPKVDSKFNQDRQRDEYVTTARYGVKLYRPENMVVVLTDTDQIL
jgi:hypothetical protein